MNFEKMIDCNDEILKDIAELHINSLGYRSFITQFGSEFLSKVYKIIINSHIGFIYYVKEKNVVLGFVCVIYGNRRLFIELIKRIVLLLPQLIKGILVNPKLLSNFIGSLNYVKKTGEDIPCELLVIAVDSQFRSRKIGQKLVELVDEELKLQKIEQYKVTVHKVMNMSRNFYEKNSFYLYDEFKMNNTEWCVYKKKIEKY